MTYKINGVELGVQPTSGRWLPRVQLGVDGNGHPIYPSVRQFEMRWQLETPTGTSQLQNFFDSIIITGTAVVDLPLFAGSDWTFFSYSGCTLREPDLGRYFYEHTVDVKLLVTRIQT
jgi:hypothetical protein